MSKRCSIPGCSSQALNTTLFRVIQSRTLSNWWESTVWSPESGRVALMEEAQICVLHFRRDQLDDSCTDLRLVQDAVPTMNLPSTLSTAGAVASYSGSGDVSNPLLIYCRFCGKKQEQPLTNHLEDLVESEELLQLCLGRGRFLEGFPSGVCDHCLEMIKFTTNFIQHCGKAQEKLQKMFFGTALQMEESFVKEETEFLSHSYEMPHPNVSLRETSFAHYEDPLDEPYDDDNDDDDDGEVGGGEYESLLTAEVKPAPKKRKYNKNSSSTDPPGEIKCTVCGRTFNRQVALKAHMESIHEGRTFACKICGKTMGWRKTLQRHMKSHEENYHKHKCPECDKSFARPSHLKLHMTSHSGTKVRCEDCKTGYRDKYKLGEHLVKVHHMDSESAKIKAHEAPSW